MRYHSLAVFALFLFFLGACDPDKDKNATGQVNLNFRAFYEGQPLVMFDQAYDYPDGMKIKFQLFQFYISDATLRRSSGEVKLSDIETVNFKDVQSTAAALRGLSFRYEVPVGEYNQLRFGLGVAPNLNATQPGDYSPTHPLAENYWSWALGYVFAKIEGNADTDGDGTFETKLTYHIGADKLYELLSFSAPINVSENGEVDVDFVVDVADILSDEMEYIDFRVPANTQDHTNNEAIYGYLWNNFKTAIQLESQ